LREFEIIRAEWGLLDHVAMQHELQAMRHRPVDLVSRRALERSQNWLRRQEILSSSRTLFREPEAAHATFSGRLSGVLCQTRGGSGKTVHRQIRGSHSARSAP
jgi:hypothetical protein